MAASAWAEAPQPVFFPGAPGINAPMDPVDDIRTKETDPIGPGWEQLAYGWEYDAEGDFVYTDDSTFAPAARYLTTIQGQEVTDPINNPEDYSEMSPDHDWVLEIVQKYEGTYGVENPWYAKQYHEDLRILACSNSGGPDQWILRGADENNNNYELGMFTLSEDDWNTWTFHYKADVPGIDIYLNGTLEIENYQPGNGAYNMNNVQIEGLREFAGRTMYKSVKLGVTSDFVPPITCEPGDADGDGDVDDDDLSLLLAHWAQDVTGDADGGCGKGEFNEVAPIDDDDLSLLLANWTGAVTPAPEPASVVLVLLGAATLARRRR